MYEVNETVKQNVLTNDDIIGFKRIFFELQRHVHSMNRMNGFWNTPEHIMSYAKDHESTEKFKAIILIYKIGLVVAELSECMESIRKDIDRPDDHCPDLKNVEVELADAIIRIMDIAGWRYANWNVGHALIEKLSFNSSRPYMHGKNA